MINRFHNAAPSAILHNSNSATSKTKAVDDFGLLLNALAGPVSTHQQPSSGLPEEIKVKQDLNGLASPFEQMADHVEQAGEQPAETFFPDTTLAGSAAILQPQNLLPPVHAENHSPRLMQESDVVILQTPIGNHVGNTQLTEHFPITPSVLPERIPVQSPIDAISVDQLAVAPVDPASPSYVSIQPDASQEVIVNASEEGFDVEAIGAETPYVSDLHATSNKYSQTTGADVELVTVPWRLQANAALSYQSTAIRLQNNDDGKNISTTRVRTTSANRGDRNELPRFANNAPAFEGLEMDRALQFYRIAEAASSLANVFENARIQRSDSRASFVMWPQRVLHWVADGDATTAWVRDYQLDDSGTRTLVVALRCFAEQQGFSLRRIMLNGHEAWRSPSTF